MPKRSFDPVPGAARAARRFARSVLQPYGEVAETAELLVSELATNVVRHTSTSFCVDVAVDCDVARVGVADGVSADLRVTKASGDETAGRGLQILDALAMRWGVERTSGGKRVWFELPVVRRPAVDSAVR